MSMIRWNPFDELASLRESMDKLFDDFLTTRRPGQRAETAPMVWQPAIEAYDTEHDVVIRAELPGINPKNVEISVTDDNMTIKGSSRAEQEERHRNYYRRELRYGAFVRSLTLPSGVQGDQAKATYRNGILEIRVPKSERAKPKSVKVEVSE